MGLFSKKPSAEELAALEENRKRLDDFEVTAAWGVKKVATAKQFIYDEKNRNFVVVDGPEETFRERNPWIVSFDQVKDVYLEVDEWWTEDGNKFNQFHNNHILLQENYSKVFWHYDFYLNIKTTHPFCENIRYQMNHDTNVLKIPGISLLVHRGLELNGTFRGQEINNQVKRLEEFQEKIKGNVKTERVVDFITGQRPDGILDKMKKDYTDEWYISRIENVKNHVKRAARISKLLIK